MDSEEVMSTAEEAGPFVDPWPALKIGLAAAVAAFVLSTFLSGTWLVICAVLVVVGLLAAAAAVVIRPWSSAVLALAAVVPLLAWWGPACQAHWDSAMLLLGVLTGIAAVSALVVLLPRPARRAAVSCLIVFHFAGILSAVTNVNPRPWISVQLWGWVFRPYLQFLYMNNAYHYYSPDPGPASLLWFRIEYQSEGGKRYWRWVQVPKINDDGEPVYPDGRPLWPRVEYTRRLSIAESVKNPAAPPADLVALRQARVTMGQVRGIPSSGEMLQYFEPSDTAKLWLSSYVRYVARNYPHQDRPELPVTGVKVYLVIHRLLSPVEFARGVDPNDLATFAPTYVGDFDPAGKMKETCQRIKYYPDGTFTEVFRDPFLYWNLPIIRVPKENKQPGPGVEPFHAEGMAGPDQDQSPEMRPEDSVLKNYLLIQAGDEDGEDQK